MSQPYIHKFNRIAVIGKGAVGQAIINGLTDELGCRARVYDSSNIETAYDEYFDLVIYAGVKASKIEADKHPSNDLLHCKRAYDILSKIRSDRKILISTIDASDMFGSRSEYGNNRRAIETLIMNSESHKNTQILRLPALYGSTVYKNAWHDAVTGADDVKLTGSTADNIERARKARPEAHFNILSTIRRDSIFAWYNLDDIIETLGQVLQIPDKLVQVVSYDDFNPNGIVAEHGDLMRAFGYSDVETLAAGANYLNYYKALLDSAARLLFERTDKSLFDPAWKESVK